jgi:peptidoglycan hydrolase-like protein with peptidoglycan-binding domain
MKKISLAVATAVVLLSATARVPAVDVSQLNMNATPTLNQDQIRRVQDALYRKGFPPGPIDGVVGPLTKGAVRKFQDRYAIEGNGDLNNQTLFALGEADLAS